MADNVTLPASSGSYIAASDDVGGIQYQKIKLDVGGDGASVPVVGSVPVTPVAQELYTGKVGSDVYSVGVVPTVSASPAYSTGDCIGGLLVFGSAARVSSGGGSIPTAFVNCKTAAITGAVDLILFDTNPAASTFTDNAALTLASVDYDKVAGVFHITDWTNLGTASVGQSLTSPVLFKLTTGTTLYGVLVARAALTLSSTTDITVNVNVIPG